MLELSFPLIRCAGLRRARALLDRDSCAPVVDAIARRLRFLAAPA